MENIPLWPTPRPGEFQPCLTPFLLDDGAVHPAVIVCPGGGYTHLAQHEGDPVSRKFNQLGFHAFTLLYRHHPQAHYPEPQLDALRAIRLVRSRSKEYRIDPNKIVILGFSAGGHVAATTTYLYSKLDQLCCVGDAADAFSPRPDGAVLCYAVISAINFAHMRSILTLTGNDTTDIPRETLLELSGEQNAHPEMPPVFLWHTAEDATVPVENSLHFAEALRRMKIPFSMRIYPFGRHGLGLAEKNADGCRWPEDAAEFFRTLWAKN